MNLNEFKSRWIRICCNGQHRLCKLSRHLLYKLTRHPLTLSLCRLLACR